MAENSSTNTECESARAEWTGVFGARADIGRRWTGHGFFGQLRKCLLL
jgi:hypothetical protein